MLTAQGFEITTQLLADANLRVELLVGELAMTRELGRLLALRDDLGAQACELAGVGLGAQPDAVELMLQVEDLLFLLRAIGEHALELTSRKIDLARMRDRIVRDLHRLFHLDKANLERAAANDVGVVEWLALDALLVHEGAVRAREIFHVPASAIDGELAVATRDHGVVGAHDAILRPADERALLDEVRRAVAPLRVAI